MPFDTAALNNPARIYTSENVVSSQLSFAEHNGVLYCGMMTSKHSALLSITSSENGLDFSPVRPTALNSPIKDGVSLAYYAGYLCACFVTPQNTLGFVYSPDSISWYTESAVIQSVTGSPFLVAHNKKLWCIYNEIDKIRLIYKHEIDSSWSTPVTLPGSPQSSGSTVTGVVFNNVLHYCYKNLQGFLEFGVFDFSDVANCSTITTQWNYDSYATLITIEDTLFCFFCQSGKIVYTYSNNANAWTIPVATKHQALGPPAAVIYNHGLSFVFKSVSNSKNSWNVVCAAYVLLENPDTFLPTASNDPQQVLKTTQTQDDAISLGLGRATITQFCYYSGTSKNLKGTTLNDGDALFFTDSPREGDKVFCEGAHTYTKIPNFIIDPIDPTSLTKALYLPRDILCYKRNISEFLTKDFTVSLMVTALSPGFLIRCPVMSLQLTSAGSLIFRISNIMNETQEKSVAISTETRILSEPGCYTITCVRVVATDELSIYLNGEDVTYTIEEELDVIDIEVPDGDPVTELAANAIVVSVQPPVEDEKSYAPYLTIGDVQLEAEFMNVGFWRRELLPEEFFHASIGLLVSDKQKSLCFWPLNGSFADVSGNNRTLIPNCSLESYFKTCVDSHFFYYENSVCLSVVGPFPHGKYNITRSLKVSPGCKTLLVDIVDDFTRNQFPKQTFLSVTGPNNETYTAKDSSDKVKVEVAGDSLFHLEIDDPDPGVWKVFLQSTGPKFVFTFLAVSSAKELEKIKGMITVDHPPRRLSVQPSYINKVVKQSRTMQTLAASATKQEIHVTVFHVALDVPKGLHAKPNIPKPWPENTDFFEQFLSLNSSIPASANAFTLDYYPDWLLIAQSQTNFINNHKVRNRKLFRELRWLVRDSAKDLQLYPSTPKVAIIILHSFSSKPIHVMSFGSRVRDPQNLGLSKPQDYSMLYKPFYFDYNSFYKLKDAQTRMKVILYGSLRALGNENSWAKGLQKVVSSSVDIMALNTQLPLQDAVNPIQLSSLLGFNKMGLGWLEPDMVKEILYKKDTAFDVLLVPFGATQSPPSGTKIRLLRLGFSDSTVSFTKRCLYVEAQFDATKWAANNQNPSVATRVLIYGVNTTSRSGSSPVVGLLGPKTKTAPLHIYENVSSGKWLAGDTFFDIFTTKSVVVSVVKIEISQVTIKVLFV